MVRGYPNYSGKDGVASKDQAMFSVQQGDRSKRMPRYLVHLNVQSSQGNDVAFFQRDNPLCRAGIPALERDARPGHSREKINHQLLMCITQGDMCIGFVKPAADDFGKLTVPANVVDMNMAIHDNNRLVGYLRDRRVQIGQAHAGVDQQTSVVTLNQPHRDAAQFRHCIDALPCFCDRDAIVKHGAPSWLGSGWGGACWSLARNTPKAPLSTADIRR